ncbi:MAG: hypothetical protein KJ609_20915 [Gammaproteobacteria bacterium]|jgi:hypothetical protein|uniref:hypothetical protein n=1 Tax=Marinomonas TaxID=28253 RepID=UPI000C1F90DF|nr:MULTISPECIES: hypothetical protein [unclassified Marinomonas]MBU1294886.1 hypothetical protein [Gammaproteobacteria bacterium]MBU1467700.1 hypothetical protein [Gammaproteobacteria bacterium]MBU2321010.1 hypothetical protein [Gammaproteobacteria bacterium]MBU2414309.1 hypothetical protein [Gammaproteobacteria bacterium]PJE54567.1 hypothetical protein TY87_15250 [Marinomonas sp. BSi20584]|tara:strand:- start:16442 stop:16657 length:216 start_codon:yes stop_codon:yes gene_type:complete
METNNTHKHSQSIANFAAIKTAIANNEQTLLKELIADQAMPELEKSYLIDLAGLGNDPAILKIIKDIPVEK